MAERTSKYIIVEDNYFLSLSLRIALAQLRPCMTLVGVSDDIQGVLALLRHNDVDLIFTKQSVGDGDMMEAFNRLGIRIPMIVISASENISGYENIKVIDFILEPLTHDSLLHALEKFECMDKIKC